MNRKQWLVSLKKGDKVCNKKYDRWEEEYVYEFYEIKNITNTGKIRLNNNVLLDNDGCYHKYENYKSVDYKIEPITDEVVKYETARRKKRNIIREIREIKDRVNFNKLNQEELEVLLELLKKGSM